MKLLPALLYEAAFAPPRPLRVAIAACICVSASVGLDLQEELKKFGHSETFPRPKGLASTNLQHWPH